MSERKPKIGILWRGEPLVAPLDQNSRLWPILAALTAAGLAPEPLPYDEHSEEQVRDRVLMLDGVLVWVDPITNGKNRARLDELLREAASKGVYVSAHPDVILKMGTKEVLFQTRELGWGTDTHLYRTVDQFLEQFPPRLAAAGTRVLKQYRGNGGLGVWKVERTGKNGVRIVQGRRDAVSEQLSLDDFMRRCTVYFGDGGPLIDQAYQPRIDEGMIRCYFVQNEVVGFARQVQDPSTDVGKNQPVPFGLPSAKTMYPADEPQFEALRINAETEWLPGMQRLLDIPTAALPTIWDADFLFGPQNDAGRDTYVLCEINISAVLPIPPAAPERIAKSVAARFL